MSPTEPGIRGEWIPLEWYDSALLSIALVTFPDVPDAPMVEVCHYGGWDGVEPHRFRYANGSLWLPKHVRFTRSELQAMLDLIDGKPVPGFFGGTGV